MATVVEMGVVVRETAAMVAVTGAGAKLVPGALLCYNKHSNAPFCLDKYLKI